MSRFVKLQLATWNDPQFAALGTDARLLFLWGWSNLDSAICGLYRTSLSEMSIALGGNREALRVERALVELAEKPMMLWDGDVEVVWVVNRAKHANGSASAARIMKREYERVPPCNLKSRFASKYRGMLRSA